MADVGLDVIRFLFQTLQIDPEWSVWSDRGFTWWAENLAQYVWAEPGFQDEEFTVTRIHVRTDLIDGFAGTDAQLLQLMEFSYLATLSGLIRNPAKPSRIQLASSIYIHAETADWLQRVLVWVAAIQNAEAHRIAPILARLTGTQLALSKHPRSGPRVVPDDMLNIVEARVGPDGQEPSRYAGQDMLDTLAFFQDPPCVLATGGEEGVSAEFPFDNFTSLLKLKTEEPNPWLGHGLLTLLSVPAGESGETNVAAARLALELNELELRTLTHSQFLGSWCPGNQALTFVSFLPNAMYLPGLSRVLVGPAMMARAAWVAIEVFRVGFDYHRAAAAVAAKKELLAHAAEKAKQARGNPSPPPAMWEVACPACGKKYSVPAALAGSSVQCECGQGFRIEPQPRGPSPGSAREQATALLARVRAETQDNCRRACTPFPAAPFLDAAKDIVPLLACGILNPFGPTLQTILLARLTSEADWLIADVRSNPFAPTENTARGWQPATLNPAELGAALVAMAEVTQEGESDFLLTQSSYIVVFPGAKIGAAVWKEIFRRALVREGATWPGGVCRAIRANWCRLWDRTKEDLGGDPAESRRDRPLTAAEFYAWWETKMIPLHMDTDNYPKSAEAQRVRARQDNKAPMTAAAFEDWWQLVTHSAHVAHEVKELPQAWRGALAQAPGVAQRMGGDPASIQFHWRILQPVLTVAGSGTGAPR